MIASKESQLGMHSNKFLGSNGILLEAIIMMRMRLDSGLHRLIALNVIVQYVCKKQHIYVYKFF